MGTLSGFMTTPILTGDNPVSTCQECGSIGKEWCTYNDMYAGGDGPMHCLKDGKAEVSFMRSTDLDYLTTSQYGNPPQFRADVSCISVKVVKKLQFISFLPSLGNQLFLVCGQSI